MTMKRCIAVTLFSITVVFLFHSLFSCTKTDQTETPAHTADQGTNGSVIADAETPVVAPSGTDVYKDADPSAPDSESEQIAVTTSPPDAEIFLAGKRLGKGYHLDTYEHGRTLAFNIRKIGFQDKTLTITVYNDIPKNYAVTLEPLTKHIDISATPRDATILLNGREVGTGYFSGTFNHGTRLSFSITHEGYKAKTLTFTVGAETANNYRVTLERIIIRATVRIRATPEAAEIRLNGRPVAAGRFMQDFDVGRTATFSIVHPGYQPETFNVVVTPGMAPIEVTLRKITIQVKSQVSRSGFVGSLITDGKTVFGSNSDGEIIAFTPEGDTLWTVGTTNNPNKHSHPVLLDDTILFSGIRAFVAADPRTGTILYSRKLEPHEAHPEGRYAVEFDGKALYPTDRSLDIIDIATGEIGPSIPLPFGSKMSPGVWHDRILIIDGQGSLLFINPQENPPMVESLPTTVTQPVASGVTVFKEKAFFCGITGKVVCADLLLKKILWERQLPGNISVTNDLPAGPAGVYVYSNGTIHGLSMLDGGDLFNPITSVTSPPLYHKNTLYYGTSSEVVIRSAARGELKNVIVTGEKTTARPVILENNTLVVGTDTGKVIVISP